MGKKEKIFPINTVGGKIQYLRHKQKLSRSELYDKVYQINKRDSSAGSESSKEKTVYNWEANKTELDYTTLCALCRTLNCSSDYLLGLEECSNKNAQFIHDKTGLSEDSQKRLHEIKLDPEYGKIRLFILNNLIENVVFSLSLTKDINNCYTNYDNFQIEKERLEHLRSAAKRAYEKAQGDITKEINIRKSQPEENPLVGAMKQQVANARDSYDASLFRIQGKFGDIISDLIQTSYEQNSTNNIPPFIPFE